METAYMTEAMDDSKFSLLRLLEPEIMADPQSLYRPLRELDPVHWDPYMHAWVVTSYQEAQSVLLHYSADRTPAPAHLEQLGLGFMKPFAEMMLKQMMFMDGSMHARLRGICSVAFTPRRVEQLRTEIASVVDELLDPVLADGHMDMIADFADPLPAIITAKLLGFPVEDKDLLHKWVLDLAEVLGNFQHHPDRVVEIVKSLEELKDYLSVRMEAERIHPTGGLLSSLMAAEFEGNKLSDDEVVANTIITLIGGHETTMNLIASGYLTLLRHPESFELLSTKPELAQSAVEELLRYECPVQHTARIAPADMQLGNKKILKGSRVVAVLAAANRDPKQFSNPETLDLTRSDNRHLAFGWAAHFCFGAPLARMEGQIAFNKLLTRLKRPRLLDGTQEWRDNAGLRGLKSLHIEFDPLKHDQLVF